MHNILNQKINLMLQMDWRSESVTELQVQFQP